jgi:hypothetical protein
MTEYTVAYVIQLDADDPQDAAERLAHYLEHDSYAARGCYDVTDEAGTTVQIDLCPDFDLILVA